MTKAELLIYKTGQIAELQISIELMRSMLAEAQSRLVELEAERDSLQ